MHGKIWHLYDFPSYPGEKTSFGYFVWHEYSISSFLLEIIAMRASCKILELSERPPYTVWKCFQYQLQSDGWTASTSHWLLVLSAAPSPPLSNGQMWKKVLQTILASLYTHTPLYTFQEGASLSLVVDSLIAPQPHLLPLQFENAHGASHNLQVAHVGGQLPHHSLFHLLPVAAIQLKLPRSHICVESGFLPISKSKAGIWSQVPSIKDGSAI